MLFSVITPAHEMTPTYPKMEPSHVKGVYKTTMQMFNKRVEVEYYEIQVYDADWKPIQFVTSYSILKIEYLSKVEFDLYVKEAYGSISEKPIHFSFVKKSLLRSSIALRKPPIPANNSKWLIIGI